MVVGIALIIRGYQMADPVGDQVTGSFTASATDAVMLRCVAGTASLALGAFIFFRKQTALQ